MIYLDANSTTPVLPEVWEAMRPYLTEHFGNPASAHAVGRKARQALEEARERIATLLDADPDEVIFTSGATESNNLALFGLSGEPPATLLASPIEHPCVIEPLKQLASRGLHIEWLSVRSDGIAQMADRNVCPTLGIIMLVNHETGAIQPVRQLVELFDCPIHCDAAQAVGKMPVRFHQLGVASMSVSGHKFGAPKGIGLLLLRRGMKLHPRMFGGHQQQGRRPGTESPALAIGLATALDFNSTRLSATTTRVRMLRNRLLSTLAASCPPIVVNSPEQEDLASPFTLNISFPGCRAELLLMKLDLAGVACSTGSACSSGSLLPSPVLQAMGVPDAVLRSAMRFSFSYHTTESDIDEGSRRIVQAVNDLRREENDPLS